MLYRYTNPTETEAPAKPLAYRAEIPGCGSLIYCTDCGVPAGITAMATVTPITDIDELYDEGYQLRCDNPDCAQSLVSMDGS